METTFMTTDQPLMDRQEFFRPVGVSVGAILLTRCVSGCAGSANPNITPNPENFTIDFTEKANENLAMKGGYLIVNDVIVAQTKSGAYVAVAANCTHQGTQRVVKPNDNQFYCPLDLLRTRN